MRYSIEKSFLIDPLTTSNLIHRDSLTLIKEKKGFNSNLDINILTENRTFWKTVSQGHQIAKTFNEYFVSIPQLKTCLKIKNMKA